MTRNGTSRGARFVGSRTTTASPPELIGVVELATRLGTTERFVRRLVAERRVPFHKVGKYVRFDPRDVDAWLSDNRVEPTRPEA